MKRETERGSEIGRKLEKKMSFSLTCSRLSHYIQQRGCCPVDLQMSFRSLSGELSTHGVATTMNLFPGNEVSDANKTDKKECISSLHATDNTEPQERAQLTIFYDGKVLVFDDFPSENAQYLMQLASKISLTRSLQISLPSFDDLPIARKASLHRFMEKRRSSAKAPYQTGSEAALN